MKLFWVEAQPSGAGRFVIADDCEEAERLRVQPQKLRPGMALGIYVCEVPSHLEVEKGAPSLDLLETCGASVERSNTRRVVEIEGEQFCERYPARPHHSKKAQT